MKSLNKEYSSSTLLYVCWKPLFKHLQYIFLLWLACSTHKKPACKQPRQTYVDKNNTYCFAFKWSKREQKALDCEQRWKPLFSMVQKYACNAQEVSTSKQRHQRHIETQLLILMRPNVILLYWSSETGYKNSRHWFCSYLAYGPWEKLTKCQIQITEIWNSLFILILVSSTHFYSAYISIYMEFFLLILP